MSVFIIDAKKKKMLLFIFLFIIDCCRYSWRKRRQYGDNMIYNVYCYKCNVYKNNVFHIQNEYLQRINVHI